MENANQITTLQLEVDILRAQIKLLHTQVNNLRKEPLRGQEEENSTCTIL